MQQPHTAGVLADVPAQAFEAFLAAASEANIPHDVIARLRKVLLQDQHFTERALSAALFPDEE